MPHTQRVILVDDSDNDNFFHDIAVRKCGFRGEIKIFDKGEDALAFLLNDRVSVPTMVFMDINMAGMGGFELAMMAGAMIQAASMKTRPITAAIPRKITIGRYSRRNAFIRGDLVRLQREGRIRRFLDPEPRPFKPM